MKIPEDEDDYLEESIEIFKISFVGLLLSLIGFLMGIVQRAVISIETIVRKLIERFDS